MQKLLSSLSFIVILMAFFPFGFDVYFQVALTGLVLIGLIWGLARGDISFRMIIHPYTLMMLILFIWSFSSILWVADRSSWIVSNGILFVIFVYGLSLSYLIRIKQFRQQLSWTLVLITVSHHLIGWFELLTRQQYFESEGWTFNWERTLSNPMIFFVNINDFALFIFFCLVFVMCWHPLKEAQLERTHRYLNEAHFQNFKSVKSESKGQTVLLILFKILMSGSSLFLIYFANARGFFSQLFIRLCSISSCILSIDWCGV